MSVIITNITKNPGTHGLHHYRLRINDSVICEFYHYREDGLSKCLRRAADAVDRAMVEKNSAERDALSLQILKTLAEADFTKFKEVPTCD